MEQSLNEISNYGMGEMKELASQKVLSIYGPGASVWLRHIFCNPLKRRRMKCELLVEVRENMLKNGVLNCTVCIKFII